MMNVHTVAGYHNMFTYYKNYIEYYLVCHWSLPYNVIMHATAVSRLLHNTLISRLG